MKLIEKIFQKLAERCTNYQEQRMARFEKVQERVIQSMIKTKFITMFGMKLNGVVITFFGCGKWRYGPGTVASLATALIWLYVTMQFVEGQVETSFVVKFWFLIIFTLFFYSLAFIPLYSRYLNQEDHPSIVIDEVIGQLIALSISYPFFKNHYAEFSILLDKLIVIMHVLSCFIIFRFLDIAKPFFIGTIDRRVKGSLGVVLDDIVAGFISGLLNIVFLLLYKDLILHSSVFSNLGM